MSSILKTMITLVLGVGVYGIAQAAASDRPDYCAIDHDHRSHNSSYYDYYDADKYYRAGSYRGASRNQYDRGGYDRRGSRDRYDDSYDRRGRYGHRRARSRVVNRETYSTRYRARITLVEEIYWTRSGREQLVCSIVVKGREAHHVPYRRLERIAHRDCSRRARIQYL